MQKGGTFVIKDILKIAPDDRTQEQKFYVRMHLKSEVPFFSNYLGSVLENICRVLK